MDWSDQTSAMWTVDAVGSCEAAEAGAIKEVVFLKKILRVVVDFDEEL